MNQKKRKKRGIMINMINQISDNLQGKQPLSIYQKVIDD
jgi:hypothetical protein